MTIYNHNSHQEIVFHGFSSPERGSLLAGYAALIEAHALKVPLPDSLCIVGTRHKKYVDGRWNVFTPRHRPEDTLYGHLTFALKYEGIDLAVLNALFQVAEAADIESMARSEPTGIYSRKIWFLWEWLRDEQLDLEDATMGNSFQSLTVNYNMRGYRIHSKRHRVRNNLPGTKFQPIDPKNGKT